MPLKILSSLVCVPSRGPHLNDPAQIYKKNIETLLDPATPTADAQTWKQLKKYIKDKNTTLPQEETVQLLKALHTKGKSIKPSSNDKSYQAYQNTVAASLNAAFHCMPSSKDTDTNAHNLFLQHLAHCIALNLESRHCAKSSHHLLNQMAKDIDFKDNRYGLATQLCSHIDQYLTNPKGFRDHLPTDSQEFVKNLDLVLKDIYETLSHALSQLSSSQTPIGEQDMTKIAEGIKSYINVAYVSTPAIQYAYQLLQNLKCLNNDETYHATYVSLWHTLASCHLRGPHQGNTDLSAKIVARLNNLSYKSIEDKRKHIKLLLQYSEYADASVRQCAWEAFCGLSVSDTFDLKGFLDLARPYALSPHPEIRTHLRELIEGWPMPNEANEAEDSLEKPQIDRGKTLEFFSKYENYRENHNKNFTPLAKIISPLSAGNDFSLVEVNNKRFPGELHAQAISRMKDYRHAMQGMPCIPDQHFDRLNSAFKYVDRLSHHDIYKESHFIKFLYRLQNTSTLVSSVPFFMTLLDGIVATIYVIAVSAACAAAVMTGIFGFIILSSCAFAIIGSRIFYILRLAEQRRKILHQALDKAKRNGNLPVFLPGGWFQTQGGHGCIVGITANNQGCYNLSRSHFINANASIQSSPGIQASAPHIF